METLNIKKAKLCLNEKVENKQIIKIIKIKKLHLIKFNSKSSYFFFKIQSNGSIESFDY